MDDVFAYDVVRATKVLPYSQVAVPLHPFFDLDRVAEKTRKMALLSCGAEAEILSRSRPGSGLRFLRCGEVDRRGLKYPAPLELVAESGSRFLRLPRSMSQAREVEQAEQSPVEDGYRPETADNEARCALDIWDEAQLTKLPTRRTWEHLGDKNPPDEKPYLTELGRDGAHSAWILAMSNLKLVDRLLHIPKLNCLPEDTVIRDISYLMIGVNSTTFAYDDQKDAFQIKNGTCIDSITPESFKSLCQPYLDCGIICRHLEQLVARKKKNQHKGLIYSAFMNGISQYLHVYRTAVMNLCAEKPHLIQLQHAMAKLFDQMIFLKKLCKLPSSCPGTELPGGLELLSHLFERAMHIHSNRHIYFILVAILRCTTEPYFSFLHRWLFRGVLQDDYGEFGLEYDPSFLNARNRLFWTNAFVCAHDFSLCQDGSKSAVDDIQERVLSCGKALNLLKLCQPHHHLCTASQKEQPRLRLLVSTSEQAALRKSCEEYVGEQERIASEKVMSVRKQKEQEEEAKKELLRTAYRRHKETLERIREHRKSQIEENKRRKQLIFEDLKGQFLAEQRRKEVEKRKKKEEDKAFLDLAINKEKSDIEREKRVKLEMEEYYRKLTAEADKREKRAKWRTKRINLRDERIRFWREENKKMQLLMDNKEHVSQTQDAPKKAGDEFKVRLRQDELNNAILILEDSEGNIVSESTTDFTQFSPEIQTRIMSETFDTLPNWLKRNLVEQAKKSSNVVKSGRETNPDLAPDVNGNEVEGVSKVPPASTVKRKRPKSFHESTEKRISESLPSPDNALVTEPGFGESLAYSLSNREGIVMRRKKKDTRDNTVHTIDGRKRRSASGKSIEQLLYPSRFSRGDEASTAVSPVSPKTEFDSSLWDVFPQAYTTSFAHLGSPTVGGVVVTTTGRSEAADTEAFMPLSMLMENSLLIPLKAQLKVVNHAVLSYLLVDAKLMDHFKALRNYLLFHDGEFAQNLSNSMFCKVRDTPSEMTNPATLNRIVENALMSSTFGCIDPLAAKVGFTLKTCDPVDLFKHLKLGFQTEWPVNIILTPDVIDVYGDIFKFMLQAKKAIWGLDQVFVDLKSLRGFELSPQVRSVHIMHHDMLNFINGIQAYVKCQVLNLSWVEFQHELVEKVTSVDSLFDAHLRYINRAMKRCILNPKAKAVQKIITDIFNIVAKFSLILTTEDWQLQTFAKAATHPSYQEVTEIYSVFKEYASFLLSVVRKLASRGYEYHLSDLLLCLDFNEHYKTKTSNNQ